jgi:hypothetical protein
LAFKLIYTKPLMLYLAGGETILMSMRLPRVAVPKEKPLAGRNKLEIDCV